MTKSEQIKELRAKTQAGMADCASALTEANGDLEKAIDIIKTKGKNIVSGRESKVASEGQIFCRKSNDEKTTIFLEINSQTDFVSRNNDFKEFGEKVLDHLANSIKNSAPFDVNTLEIKTLRDAIITSTKENIVIRRWWVEQVFNDYAKTFSYMHTGSKLGAIVSMMASTKEMVDSYQFAKLGAELAMQVVAMNPLAVSAEKLPADVVERQTEIFKVQLQELKRPQAQWVKIIAGKSAKWHSEVCLLDQESVIHPKKMVRLVIQEVADKLGGTIDVINLIRAEVGAGIEIEKVDFATEVSQLSGMEI